MATLWVQHYHFRPGGVRAVIERGLAAWARSGRWTHVVLLSGEPPPAAWLDHLRAKLPNTSISTWVTQGLAYAAEHPLSEAEIARSLRNAFFQHQPDLVWSHNLSVGRNVMLGRSLGRICQDQGIPLLCHHHDWWVEHRWQRWPEMIAQGIGTLETAAQAVLPIGPRVWHACVNPRIAEILKAHFGSRVQWICNPQPPMTDVADGQIERLREVLGTAPYWLAPCRILRRKNLLESLVLTRLLSPAMRLVVSGDASSSAEASYAQAVAEAARRMDLDYQPGVAEKFGLTVPTLMAGAHTVVQTSVHEGDGLVPLECARAQRPLVLRHLSGRAQSVRSMAYEDLAIPPQPFAKADWHSRVALLPPPWQAEALACKVHEVIHFSHLSLNAQRALLADWPRTEKMFMQLNPWLAGWHRATPAQALSEPPDNSTWVTAMEELLAVSAPEQGSSLDALTTIFRASLPESAAFPLLW